LRISDAIGATPEWMAVIFIEAVKGPAVEREASRFYTVLMQLYASASRPKGGRWRGTLERRQGGNLRRLYQC
jgi:hypothetical protein